MDEKWKVSKKEKGSSSSTKSSLFSRSCSTRGSTSKSPLLLRSLSSKSSSTSNNNNNLPRSFSQKNPSSIGKKCTNIAKEQKARFYIMRRCVAMLVCWHKHGDKYS
ncbi:small polypeptide DEVIL 13 [Cicer arietinum]|uniref:Uncharacterized protein LOC101490200 n=1 Tax=Cicer arietinum TaxID=3827 RepID=A0A1S2YMS3_CICAR|nr:uncharacterized protein LOC101490200 [Cicer arietinum]